MTCLAGLNKWMREQWLVGNGRGKEIILQGIEEREEKRSERHVLKEQGT